MKAPMTTGKISPHAKQIIAQFSHQAPSLSAARGSSHDEAIRQLLAVTRVGADDVALDVACGTGQDRPYHRAAGNDPSLD
jgi:hypothetical protein